VTPPVPFTRYTLPDPQTNQALQDVYNKLAQVSEALARLQASPGTVSQTTAQATTAYALAHASAPQSIPNNTATPVTMDAVDTDTGGIVSGSKFTAPVKGLYLVVGQVGFAGSAAGTFRRSAIYVNGAIPIPFPFSINLPSAVFNVIPVSAIRMMDKGDFCEFNAFQDSGGALNTLVFGPAFYCWGSLWLLTPL